MEKDIKYKVYMHTTPNGKKYIGITMLKLDARWRNGKGYRKQLFGRAIKKHGWENIKHEVLHEGLSKEQAIEIEISLIREHQCTNPEFGYNTTIGGEGSSGFSPTKETREKLSMANSGENAPWYGKNLLPCAREKISKKVKQLWEDEEYRRNQMHKHAGKKMSDETKRKMSALAKERWNDDEFRSKCTQGMINAWADPEIREKKCANMRKAWESEELRKWKSESQMGEKHHFYGKHHTDETKQKLRDVNLGKVGFNSHRGVPVFKYDLCGNFIERYGSGRQAALANGIDPRNLSSALHGRSKTAGGFIWKQE